MIPKCGLRLSGLLLSLALVGNAQVRPLAVTNSAVSAAGRATVRSVSSADHRRFTLAQVSLPGTAATARINRELVAIFEENMEASALKRAAHQAVIHALATYHDMGNQGFTNASFEVLYNAQNLLSMAFYYEYLGAYPSTATRHATFDLRTGRLVTIGQLLADTLALRQHWQKNIDHEVAAVISSLPTDYPDLEADGRDDIQERLGWNSTLRKVEFEPGQPRFDDFALTPTGLTLFLDFGFPHVIQALEPNEAYGFTYSTLKAWIKPNGLLGFRTK